MTARKSHYFKARPAGTLKEAEDRLIKAVGVERAADLVSRSRTQIYRITDPAEADSHLSADQVRTLEQAAAEPIVTAFLAAEAGCALLPLGDADVDGDVPRDFAAYADRSAGLIAAYAKELADDGQIDGEEAGVLIGKLDRVMASLASFRAELVAKAGDGR